VVQKSVQCSELYSVIAHRTEIICFSVHSFIHKTKNNSPGVLHFHFQVFFFVRVFDRKSRKVLGQFTISHGKESLANTIYSLNKTWSFFPKLVSWLAGQECGQHILSCQFSASTLCNNYSKIENVHICKLHQKKFFFF